jgi:hypothetical protein
MRTASRPTEGRETTYAQMVEDPRDIRGVIAHGPARLWIRQAETGSVQRDVPQARAVGSLVQNEAASWRAMTVNDRRSGGRGIAPHGVTHMPAVTDLQTSRAERTLHRAETTSSSE